MSHLPPTPTSGRARRVVCLSLCAGAALLLLSGYLAVFAASGRGMPCLLRLLTGWRCGLCGMTHAALAILDGHFSAAFACNALWPLCAAYLAWVARADAAAYVRRGEVQLLPAPLWPHLLVAGALVGYGILRNLPL